MFQFSALALIAEWYTFSVPGCPIRKSSDITLVCSSPKLIAAYHVLLRLIDPRHPPYALICFKKVYSVLDPHTISKVQRRRPLVFNITIKHVYLSYILLLTTYFPNMSKNYKQVAPNEAALLFANVKVTNLLDPYVYILLFQKNLFLLMASSL